MIEFKKLLLVVPILILLCLVSCKDDDSNTEESITSNCPFEQNDDTNDGLIDENESQIMDDCFANKLTEQAEVEANLIGEWTLIGHGEGWIPSRSQPCANLTFTTDLLTFNFQNNELDISATSSWNVDILQGGELLLITRGIDEGSGVLNINTFAKSICI